MPLGIWGELSKVGKDKWSFSTLDDETFREFNRLCAKFHRSETPDFLNGIHPGASATDFICFFLLLPKTWNRRIHRSLDLFDSLVVLSAQHRII